MRFPRFLAATVALVAFLAATTGPASAAPARTASVTRTSHHHHHRRPRRRRHHAAPAPAPAPAPQGRSQSGKASYYNATPGGCAHRTLPKGTRVTVHGPRGVTTCRVDDTGPFVAGRIIDLSPAEFSAIAGGTSAGVVPVTITW